jgi:hypothetical protein
MQRHAPNGSFTFPTFTRHASDRASYRGVWPEDVELCLEHALPRHSHGAQVFLLRARDLDENGPERAAGTTVVLADDGAIITVYRRRRTARLGRPRARLVRDLGTAEAA